MEKKWSLSRNDNLKNKDELKFLQNFLKLPNTFVVFLVYLKKITKGGHSYDRGFPRFP